MRPTDGIDRRLQHSDRRPPYDTAECPSIDIAIMPSGASVLAGIATVIYLKASWGPLRDSPDGQRARRPHQAGWTGRGPAIARTGFPNWYLCLPVRLHRGGFFDDCGNNARWEKMVVVTQCQPRPLPLLGQNLARLARAVRREFTNRKSNLPDGGRLTLYWLAVALLAFVLPWIVVCSAVEVLKSSRIVILRRAHDTRTVSPTVKKTLS